MILIEGPDRCGKSTVAKEVMKLLPRWSYRHHTKPPVDPVAYFSWFLADARPRVVVDRLHWSDYAYGKTYDEVGMKLTPHEWRMVELALATQGTTVLLLTDAAENIVKRWGKDEMYPVGPLNLLLERYEELADQTSTPVISRLPVRYARLPELVNDGKPTTRLLQIVAAAEQEAARSEKLMAPSVGCGGHDAEFMVVGEAPGDGRYKGGVLRPQMPFSSGRASEWLWRAFDGMGLKWWRGYFTNADAFAGPADFQDYFFDALSNVKTVLCLGAKARKLVAEAMAMMKPGHAFRPVIAAVDHPAYARRFRYDEFLEWQAEIYHAMKEHCG